MWSIGWVVLIVAVLGCRIEDRTPTGTREDEAAIRRVLTDYHRRLSAADPAAMRELYWPGATYSTDRSVPLDSALPRLLRAISSGGAPPREVRVVRLDLRQEGNLAAAWVTVRDRLPDANLGADVDRMDHFVLRRGAGGWRIASVAVGQVSRRGRRSR